MASDDQKERLRGTLALALVVFLTYDTYEKRRRARTLDEWALVLDVLTDTETAERGENEDSYGPRVNGTRHIPPRSVSPTRRGL